MALSSNHPSTTGFPSAPWSHPSRDVLQELHTQAQTGLSKKEAAERLQRFGPNTLRSHAQRSAWSIWIDQFRSLIVVLLLVAALAAWAFGETLEAVSVAVVISVNALVGFGTEMRAVRSMEVLRQLGRVATRVRRSGITMDIEADTVVPGDIVLIEGGDVITADLRILDASNLQADESTLTGESLPVSKNADPVPEDTILAERADMLFKGTSISRGSGEAVVVATGMDTELGTISRLVEQSEEPRTPLELRLDRLGNKLLRITLVIAALATLAGVARGREWLLMVEMGVALAVAAVPEGLPVVATIALASGLREMARRNALINRLSSVETLGATTVILTDKTGTLTANQMEAIRIVTADIDLDTTPDDGYDVSAPAEISSIDSVRLLLETGVLCNNASIEEGISLGDPTELALLRAGDRLGIPRATLLQGHPRVSEEAFDPDTRMMATCHGEDDHFLIAVKGAPDHVLSHATRIFEQGAIRPMSPTERDDWLTRNDALAADGLRVLGFAMRESNSSNATPYENLVFLGLAGLQDPPRADVATAISSCREAGVDVVMVTGDQQATARAVASSLGIADGPALQGRDLLEPVSAEQLLDYRIFSRVNPEQKLQILRAFQDAGHTVAMTGDGVNDAPALKAADIGVAMGLRGTQVAKEAADMILKDDAFSTIVVAIERGRVIFDNIRRFLVFLLSCNLSEVLVVGLASAAGAPLPILPLQLLFLNFVTDIFPALALGVGTGEPGIMQRPPRPSDEDILGRRQWVDIGIFGALITFATLSVFGLSHWWLELSPTSAITTSFLTLALAQLWNVVNMRTPGSPLLANDVLRNRWVLRSLALCVLLVLGAVYIPPLAAVLSLVPPTWQEWLLIVGFSLFPVVTGQWVLAWRNR